MIFSGWVGPRRPTQPQDYQGGESKRGEWGLIKVKKQVDFKIHFRRFRAFLDHVFLFFFH